MFRKTIKDVLNYITPPGVSESNCLIIIPYQSERAIIVVRVGEGLELGDSRAVLKNVSIDMRQFKKTENVFAC
jgi:hypothetical protein